MIKIHARFDHIKKSVALPHTPLTAEPKRLAIKTHHSRAFRKRHVSVLTISLLLLAFLLLQVGVIMGSNRRLPPPQTLSPTKQKSNFTLVRSSYGYGLDFDINTFAVTATAIDDKNAVQTVGQDDLSKNKQLNQVTLKPRKGVVEARFASNQLSVQVLPSNKEFNGLKQNLANVNAPDGDIVAQLFPISSSAEFDVSVTSSNPELPRTQLAMRPKLTCVT